MKKEKQKKLTMDQKWHNLWKVLTKQPLRDAALGVPCSFRNWSPAGARWIEGHAVACLFGPLGGRYIIVRAGTGLYKVQWTKVKYDKLA